MRAAREIAEHGHYDSFGDTAHFADLTTLFRDRAD
jgi:hypothetical protein